MPTLITRNGGSLSSVDYMRVVKKAISDGVIDGCSMTKSGAAINITAGHIVACGALVEIESASMNVSASGELVLKIDTTSETPAQLLTRASSTLTQQDLTNGGTVYELRLATYTVSSGNVSAISIKVPNSPTVYVQQAQPSSPSVGDLWFW